MPILPPPTAVLLPSTLTATALPLRTGPTFTRPNWPAWVTLKPLPPWHRVSRLGSSSACSSSRSCIVTAGRVDMNPPSGVICLGRADRACPRSRVPGSLGPARRPYGAGPEPDVRLSTYILFGYHRTVLFTPGLGKGY